MLTLKKPFILLLILSHLNAFVLGGVGNVEKARVVIKVKFDSKNGFGIWLF
jgi:hypothetical protein